MLPEIGGADQVALAGKHVALIGLGAALSAFMNNVAALALLMPVDMQAADKAWTGLMGGSGQVGYDMENADVVLLAGAVGLTMTLFVLAAEGLCAECRGSRTELRTGN